VCFNHTGCGERLDDLLAAKMDILDLMGAAITDSVMALTPTGILENFFLQNFQNFHLQNLGDCFWRT
jgi:hypothetical protein